MPFPRHQPSCFFFLFFVIGFQWGLELASRPRSASQWVTKIVLPPPPCMLYIPCFLLNLGSHACFTH